MRDIKTLTMDEITEFFDVTIGDDYTISFTKYDESHKCVIVGVVTEWEAEPGENHEIEDIFEFHQYHLDSGKWPNERPDEAYGEFLWAKGFAENQFKIAPQACMKINQNESKPLSIGDEVWLFDPNHRVYEDDLGNKTRVPWYRGYYIQYYIVGETKISWIINRHPDNPNHIGDQKVKKSEAGKKYFTLEEIDRLCWIGENTGYVADKIRTCRDYDSLKLIEGILALIQVQK